MCFSGTFFQKKMQEGDFSFLFFLPFSNKNNVPTMFRKNFQLLISGAESWERVHQNSTNQPIILTSKQGKWQPNWNGNSRCVDDFLHLLVGMQ